MRSRLRACATPLCFAVLPAVIVIAMFAVAQESGSLSVDFHNELYPEAKKLLDWENPFPGPEAELWHGHNLIWPPRRGVPRRAVHAALAGAADWAIAITGLALFMLSLRIVGVRDWRVYGVFAMWPSVIGEIRVSHLTPVLCLLAAVAWRYRDTRGAPGLAVGLAAAIKFFLWPLGVWLAATGRRTDAAIAALVAGSSLLLVLPFTGLDDYVRSLARAGPHLRPGQLLAARIPRPGRRARRSRASRARRHRRDPARRLLAPCELRPGDRRGARALADRLARLLRRRSRPAGRRSPEAVRGVARAARDLGPAERRDRRRERLGQRPRADRLRDRLRGDRARGAAVRG